jgi:hypothetical protein
MKEPEYEVDHLSNAEVKNAWSFASISPYIFIVCCLTIGGNVISVIGLICDM